MTSPSSTSTAIIVTVLLLVPTARASQHPGSKPPPAVNPDARAFADFKARVDEYVELRKKADDTAPPLKETNDPAKIKDAQLALVERIGAARAGAKQGDIFTPEIAARFKRLLRPESKEPGAREIMTEDKPVAVTFQINGPYPDKQPLATVPPNILEALPQLPKDQDIDYRFVGKHLILRDGRANTIIDYILNALP